MHFPCSKQRVGVNSWPQRRQIWLVTPVGPAAATHMSVSGVCFWARGVSVEVWRRQHLHKCECVCVCLDFCQSDKANTVSTTALPNTSVDNIIQKHSRWWMSPKRRQPGSTNVGFVLQTCSLSACHWPVTVLPSVVLREYWCRGCFYDCALVAAMWGGPGSEWWLAVQNDGFILNSPKQRSQREADEFSMR